MSGDRGGLFPLLLAFGQMAAQGLVGALAVAMVVLSVLGAIGWMPWPEVPLTFGGVAVSGAGMWAQLVLTAFAVLLLLMLPANRRMARLERSHRSFAMGIEDVSRAYRIAHAHDRAGVFALSPEFDSVRARMEHLRKHPDLQHLEPELLQLAAQMSHETRELARAYSDDKVARARGFLTQRQEDVQALTDRLSAARRTCDELRRWMHDVDAEERQAQVQLKRLEADLRDLLPTLGYSMEYHDSRDDNVVNLPKPAK